MPTLNRQEKRKLRESTRPLKSRLIKRARKALSLVDLILTARTRAGGDKGTVLLQRAREAIDRDIERMKLAKLAKIDADPDRKREERKQIISGRLNRQRKIGVALRRDRFPTQKQLDAI